ncbi:MAG: protoglobin domain-containing protein [Myxococcota bacterium]
MTEHLFDELKRYVDFLPADEDVLRSLRPVVRPHMAAIVDDFYDHILRHPGARNSITGGDAQVERLKGTLVLWLEGLFTGPWDQKYYEQRARIGRRHVQINLPQQYMFAAVNVIRGHLVDVVLQHAGGEEARRQLHSVNKILDMELAIMLHTYREDYLLQVQRSERLATFGQLVASIGHELRNPLSVMESSLYLLRSRAGNDERTLRHLDKMDAQLRVSNRIITDLLAMIRDRPPTRKDVNVKQLVDMARETASVPATVRVTEEIPANLPPVHVDPDQIRQIFLNLLDNAADASGPQGEIRISARAAGEMVSVVINDSGPGIDPAIRARLFEPLVTTKARGIGLGLALCRKYAERNGGTMAITAGALPGAAFEVKLPTRAPGGSGA